MTSYKAIGAMVVWTGIAVFGLFSVGAFEHFRYSVWAVGITATLLSYDAIF